MASVELISHSRIVAQKYMRIRRRPNLLGLPLVECLLPYHVLATRPQILENPHQRQFPAFRASRALQQNPVKLQAPRADLRTRPRSALIQERRRTRTQDVPNLRPIHRYIPDGSLDRTIIPVTWPPNLPDLVHSQHPPPRSSESSKELFNTNRRGSFLHADSQH